MSAASAHLEDDEKRIRGEMAKRFSELQRINDANVKSRLAALNIMEDAVEARVAADREAVQRQRVEKQLRAAGEQLEKRVGERTAELNKSNEALRKEISERKKIEIERRKLIAQLADAEENERRRISRELHDEVGQQLAALTLSLKAMESSKGKANTILQEARRIAEEIGLEIHDLALELRPSALDDLGLAHALSNYADEWSKKTKIAVRYHCAGFKSRRLPTSLETAIYRIAQEALTNVLKHARAKHVNLILERRTQLVSLIVEDDGLGFDTKKKLAKAKLGIFGMRERAFMLDGDVTFESNRKNGTTIFCPHSVAPNKREERMKKIRVCLVDDHAVVREGLKRILENEPGLEVVGEAAGGREALSILPGKRPHVVVMDVSMPEMNGARATRLLCKKMPKVAVLVLTIHEDKGYVRELMRIGACGYILKRTAGDELIRAIKAVAEGQVYIDPRVAANMVDTAASDERRDSAKARLSERENTVLRLIARGYSNKEIGAQLQLSVKTIETYKVRSMEKLGLRGRVDVVRYAHNQGWLGEIPV